MTITDLVIDLLSVAESAQHKSKSHVLNSFWVYGLPHLILSIRHSRHVHCLPTQFAASYFYANIVPRHTN